MSNIAIRTHELTKTFKGDVNAVNGLNLKIELGSVYGLIGKNGAGKTTLIRLLLGLLHATRGSARILGTDMWTASHSERARVSYVSQAQKIHDWMTLEELSYYASHFYPSWDGQYAKNLANRFSIKWKRSISLMSGGEQRKASIIFALTSRPEVLILDEPAAGLDPIARRELVDELIELISAEKECTVLFSTHIINDLERLADHIGIMDKGKLILSSRLDELQSTSKRVQIIFDNDAPPQEFSIPGALRMRVSGSVATCVIKATDELQVERIKNTPNARVQIYPLGLEDIFIELFNSEERKEFNEE